MEILHSCKIPSMDFGSQVIDSASGRWRCKVCGQYWSVSWVGPSYCASRSVAFHPNIKLWLWRRRMKHHISLEER